jgi:hypothetical protein
MVRTSSAYNKNDIGRKTNKILPSTVAGVNNPINIGPSIVSGAYEHSELSTPMSQLKSVSVRESVN